MGLVYAEIELINGAESAQARKHQIGEEEIKRMTVTALVDTGANMLAINENIQSYLQLPVIKKSWSQLADGNWLNCDVVGPVEVLFKNRQATCNAVVLPEDSEVLLGAIPIQEMDVLIDPNRHRLIVHPDHPDIAHVRFGKIHTLD